MKDFIALFNQHTALLSILGTWFFNNVLTAFVGSFPAPTKDSSARYVYWFKFSNTVIGNIKRAQSTSIESSPNFLAAVEKHLAENGQNPSQGEPK